MTLSAFINVMKMNQMTNVKAKMPNECQMSNAYTQRI